MQPRPWCHGRGAQMIRTFKIPSLCFPGWSIAYVIMYNNHKMMVVPCIYPLINLAYLIHASQARSRSWLPRCLI
ncbi:hypothetical protein QBC33DRAFT_249739 [Phialemonium atrogriseum]|uniref:Uncharacterized protein n=1 Tax=Phialemonium atrogriseum TaxID=1093897 RepID=A0AAJ0BS94_9PEZI|nr:uncharacterized protein QBC33DRAFT_249739 [Phialemonium atrogriseum]KAK1763112.1 hypothetical protein QBC33DRAFT_249739 [Phialemonium atrogriseum]